MAVLVLAVVLIFTLLIFRLLCFRTTLSVRSLATFFVLGSILGVLALPVAEKFFNSYHFEGSPAYALLMIATQHLLMVLPVLILISRPAWRNGASLGDAFLAGAMIGLGYEFLSSFIGVMATTGIPASFSFSFLPPGVVAATPHTVAGFADWTGAVALACAASLRFFNRRIIAVLVTCVMLLIVALDSYAAWYTTDFAKSVDKITLHGGLLAWLVLLLVVASAVMERRWAGPQATTWPFAEIQSVLTALVGLNWHEARRRGAEFRLKRQLENLNASTKRQPANPSLEQETQAVTALLRSVAQPAAKTA